MPLGRRCNAGFRNAAADKRREVLCGFAAFDFLADGGGSFSELEPLPLTDDLTAGNFAGTWRPAAIGWLLTKALSSAVRRSLFKRFDGLFIIW